ncbi:hypothetical protein RclHR1_03120004 [Rhizophagus clarus]|uniref:Uncharacterized protein n=1 Tax=Rhizophagus clarus TaxID=94130 RepID=A0A2Z6RLK8_9GLOM|nr:hypothetical protein RclHR1_03120004 [Rhizophagus clarus]GES74043.1 hypothetical protein GLOIN_2v1496757 [Rhizophagus clarus]
MEQNNSSIVKKQINEYKELVEKVYIEEADNCTYSKQPLTECRPYIQHDNSVLQQSMQCSSKLQPASTSTSLESNRANQECATTSQDLDVQQTQFELNCDTTQPIIKIEPESISPLQANSFVVGDSNRSIPSPPQSKVITAAVPKMSDVQENEMKNTPKPNITVCTENLKPIELTKSSSSSFRAVEFVLENLDSVPGEEKFYNWSDKAKDFANIQLSKESRERFYEQNINSNLASSYNSQSTSVFIAENEQQTDLTRYEPSKRKSNYGSSPKRMNKVLKNAKWAAERDSILKKYSKHLMRKKPKSWQP